MELLVSNLEILYIIELKSSMALQQGRQFDTLTKSMSNKNDKIRSHLEKKKKKKRRYLIRGSHQNFLHNLKRHE